MGACQSASPRLPSAFRLIPDRYSSYEEVTAALRQAGLERSQLVVGVDFTGSNEWSGKRSFAGRSLHDVSDPASPNPYHQALTIVSKALWDFDDDHMIPAYGFGDAHTGGQAIFSFQEGDRPCKGLTGCLQRYQEIAQAARLWGPTSFAPLIRQAIRLVRETNEYHILVIIADGQVSQSEVKATTAAIVEASNYALSIVMVGVGDGPWDLMDRFDDLLPQRRFDNFQFVDFAAVFSKYPKEKRELAFATHALMEVPEQYRAVRRLGLLGGQRPDPIFAQPPAPLKPPDCPARPQDPWFGLPDGWDAVRDEKGGWCYFNGRTKETTRKRPSRADAAASDNASTDTGSSGTRGTA